ncbi:MAG: PQQ-like beta-propeller repeat protein, partial [Planctomycetota bacterium]|nr:PQQ-like beta-propeller repeat protein [Planctomycetota bacterium]
MSEVADVGGAKTEPMRSLRIWPAMVIAIGSLCAVFLTTALVPGTMTQFIGMMFGPIVGLALFCLWWLFASVRPNLRERILGVVLFLAAGWATHSLAHPSITLGLLAYGVPMVISLVTIWFLLSGSLSWPVRRTFAAILSILGWGFWSLLRLNGVDGAIQADLAWRWSSSREDTYVRSMAASHKALPLPDKAVEIGATLTLQSGDWSEFRGPQRDSRIEGVNLAVDWKSNPPKEIWRREIGPGWSSFAIVGDRVYTQEQRGEDEVVLCLDAVSGKDLWTHADKTRFWESMAGAGPRATPTFHEGKIYATGATGKLNCLDAAEGTALWTRDVGVDADAKPPQWGFASSPLIVGDLVLVYAGGGPGKGLLAYRAETGEPVWKGGSGKHSYSSPQRANIDGVEQVLMLTELGVFSVNPLSGELLWEHAWPVEEMNRSVQPNIAGNVVFLGTGIGIGTRAVAVKLDGTTWTANEQWTSKEMKPYFNDFVIVDNHAYGFDGNIFCCVDITSGKRQWKRGRYGNGQVLLLADQKLLLIISETGELVILAANPTRHEELIQMSVLEGKTWN